MELIMLGGNILTMDGKRSRAQAMAIENNKITAIGNNNQIVNMANDQTKVVHLRGRTVTPGFIDPHNHFSMTVFEPVSVDSRTPPLRDKKAVSSKAFFSLGLVCLVLIVGTGLYLHQSEGFYKSTVHRVVNPNSTKNNISRYSMPLFIHPRNEVRLSDSLTAEQYLNQRLKEIGLK